MSRLAKKPISVPPKTEVSFVGGVFTVKGPLGQISKPFNDGVTITIADGNVTLAPKDNTIFARSLVGTYASHVKNMFRGVVTAYEKKLILEGVGYKSDVRGTKLVLSLGFSHPVEVDIPAGLTVKAEKNEITVSGIDKDMVGEFAASVRARRKPEPYKGKGFRYADEVIRRKQGKKAV